jgi:hypothetical protein
MADRAMFCVNKEDPEQTACERPIGHDGDCEDAYGEKWLHAACANPRCTTDGTAKATCPSCRGVGQVWVDGSWAPCPSRCSAERAA